MANSEKIILIQKKWRKYFILKNEKSRQAVVIQKNWRAHSIRDKIYKIFQIYNLINNLSYIFTILCKRTFFFRLLNLNSSSKVESLLKLNKLYLKLLRKFKLNKFNKWYKKAILKTLKIRNNYV